MNYRMDKTLVVGLGGTGQKSLLNLKKKFIDNYGEVPPMIKFMSIDSDSEEKLGKVEFKGNEFIKLEIENANEILKAESVQKWLPDLPEWIFTNDGAAQIRSAGRLYLHANFEDVQEQLEFWYNQLQGLTQADVRKKGYSLINTNRIYIFIVSSLAGGTGSGTVVDVAAFLRNLAPNGQMIGFLLFPDIFTSQPSTDKVLPNTYAAMREINSFISKNNKYVPEYKNERYPCPKGLFNHHFLINNKGAGHFFADLDDLVEYIGLSLHHFISTFSQDISSIYVNLSTKYSRLLEGQWTRYSSFGISELYYPIDNHIKLNKLKKAKEFFENMDIGEGNNPNTSEQELKKDASEFLKKIKIEEHYDDQLINSLSKDLEENKFLTMPRNRKKANLENLVDKANTFVDNEKKHIVENISKNKKTILKNTIAKINEKVGEVLFQYDSGIGYTKVFLSNMIGFIDDYEDEMEKEKQDFKKKNKSQTKRFEVIKKACRKDAGRRLFGGSKIRRDFDDIEKSIKLINRYNLEIERRKAASEIFLQIKGKLKDWKKRIINLSTKSSDLIEKLSKEISNLTNQRNTSTFIQKIGIKKEKIKTKIRVKDFINWISKKKNITIDQFMKKEKNSMEKAVLDYISTFEEIKDMENNTIGEYFENLDPDEKINKLQSLETDSKPMWKYDKGKAFKLKIDRVFLFGVDSPDGFDEDTINEGLKKPDKKTITSTDNPHKLICCQFDGACPAYIIKNMVKYRKEYNNIQKNNSQYEEDLNFFYTQKNLEEKLLPLFPAEDKTDNKHYWTLANADLFDLVIRNGVYYSIKSDKFGKFETTPMGKIKIVQLTSGRKQSFEKFIENEELVEEIKQEIDKVKKSKGVDKIVEELENHLKYLKNELTAATSKNKIEILTLEIEEIEKYINRIK